MRPWRPRPPASRSTRRRGPWPRASVLCPSSPLAAPSSQASRRSGGGPSPLARGGVTKKRVQKDGVFPGSVSYRMVLSYENVRSTLTERHVHVTANETPRNSFVFHPVTVCFGRRDGSHLPNLSNDPSIYVVFHYTFHSYLECLYYHACKK